MCEGKLHYAYSKSNLFLPFLIKDLILKIPASGQGYTYRADFICGSAEFKIPTKFLAVVNQQPKPPTWAKIFFIFLLIKK